MVDFILIMLLKISSVKLKQSDELHLNLKQLLESVIIYGGMAEWLTHWTSNIMIDSRMGSNPVRGMSLFPGARNFTFIAQYWLVPGTDSKVCLEAYSFLHNRTKINSVKAKFRKVEYKVIIEMCPKACFNLVPVYTKLFFISIYCLFMDNIFIRPLLPFSIKVY
jgi:hypothetical protein